MWFDIILWVSISLCWVVCGLNVWSLVGNYRASKKYMDCAKRYHEAYMELIKRGDISTPPEK